MFFFVVFMTVAWNSKNWPRNRFTTVLQPFYKRFTTASKFLHFRYLAEKLLVFFSVLMTLGSISKNWARDRFTIVLQPFYNRFTILRFWQNLTRKS